VRLQTSGLVPLPGRGRFNGCLVEFVGVKPWASVEIERSGGYDWRTRQVRPRDTRPALRELPEFVAVAAKVASKPEPEAREGMFPPDAQPSAPKRRSRFT
jgi:hypothetical protein